MFAAFARYKAESYRHSEFAPRILHDNDLRVIMKVLILILFARDVLFILFHFLFPQSDRKFFESVLSVLILILSPATRLCNRIALSTA